MLQMLFAFLIAVVQVSRSPGWLLLKLINTRHNDAEFDSLIRAHEEYSTLGVTARAFLRTAVSSYNIWFWFKGVDTLPTQMSCSPVIFLFAPLQLEKAKTAFQVISILYFYFVGSSLYHVARIFAWCKRQLTGCNISNAASKEWWLKSFKKLWKLYIESSTTCTTRKAPKR
jgi:hypothetical protein